MSKVERCAVRVSGSGETAIVFLHGYGCDSGMWSKVAPVFESRFKVITYDLMGYGQSAIEHYDRARYATLDGHAEDLIDILDELDLNDVIAVGHSVSAMTVARAANMRPDLIAKNVMICPSPSYLNDGDYIGGFEERDLLGLIDILEVNYLGWASDMAPAIMGTPDRPDLGEKLSHSFCQTDPDIAKHFARVTFLTDLREEVKKVAQPTLVLQCRDDILVPDTVRAWLEANLQRGEQVLLDATGHCPHMSFPEQTSSAILAYLQPAAPQ